MRKQLRALGALTVMVGGVTAGVAGLAGPAGAAACGPAVLAGTSCTATGTVNLLAGPLTLTSPSSLAWSGTLNGANQSLVDTNAADQQYTVNDATGSGSGWHVTTSATTFTTGTATLPNTNTFSTTGSVTSVTATTAPTATCATGATCLLPTNTTSYPVAITTAAVSPTALTIYDTAILTGLGQVVIGGSTKANPVGWWVNIPASAVAGTYTSTITMQIISGP